MQQNICDKQHKLSRNEWKQMCNFYWWTPTTRLRLFQCKSPTCNRILVFQKSLFTNIRHAEALK